MRRLESVAALLASTAFSLLAAWRLLRPNVLSDDALVHQYWLWRYRDPLLFTDPLTEQLRESARYPDGYELLFRVASQVFDPIAFGEWVGIGAMAISGWLVFLIVREHTSWRPAAWIGLALFLSLAEIHRFYGGFPRAFVHPVVLLTVLLAMRRHHLTAAVVAAAGALFYPTAALLASGVLLVSSVGRPGRRPRLETPRLWFALLALGGTVAGVLVPALLSGGTPDVFTAGEARRYPEFGPDGALHFFVPSTVEYLEQNRSGVDLRGAGSILVLAAIALLVLRPANLRLLRREVLAMPIVALIGFAAAHAVLFRLYLPHRYTYPLVAFAAIAVAVSLLPTWEALLSRRRAGARTAPAVGAAVAALALLGAMLVATETWTRGTVCRNTAATAYLASLPKDAVIAGDPHDLRCIPATARRPVVISTQLAPAYEVDYFLHARERMFAMLRAYYGPSTDAVVALADRYGATHLWVRPDAVRGVMASNGGHWRRGDAPYGRFVQRLLRGGEPAVLHLPAECRSARSEQSEIYDIRCIAGREG